MTLSRADLKKVCTWGDSGAGGSELYVLYAVKGKPDLFILYCDRNLMGWESESWNILHKSQHPKLIAVLSRKKDNAKKAAALESVDLERADIVN